MAGTRGTSAGGEGKGTVTTIAPEQADVAQYTELPARVHGPGPLGSVASRLADMDAIPPLVPSGLRRGMGVVHAAEYWTRPDAFIRRCIDAPKRFTLDLPGAGTMIGLRDPEDIKQVFTTGAAKLQMSPVSRKFFPHAEIFGDQLAIWNFEPWATISLILKASFPTTP